MGAMKMNKPTYFCVIPLGRHRYRLEGWYKEGWFPLFWFDAKSDRQARIEGGMILRRWVI